jgi:hypothetical protein
VSRAFAIAAGDASGPSPNCADSVGGHGKGVPRSVSAGGAAVAGRLLSARMSSRHGSRPVAARALPRRCRHQPPGAACRGRIGRPRDHSTEARSYSP